MIFPVAGNEGNRLMKNFFLMQTRFWATAQLYCKKKKKLYCNVEIVLQEIREKAVDCIAA